MGLLFSIPVFKVGGRGSQNAPENERREGI